MEQLAASDEPVLVLPPPVGILNISVFRKENAAPFFLRFGFFWLSPDEFTGELRIYFFPVFSQRPGVVLADLLKPL